MKCVQKGNKQLCVTDDRAADLLTRGYVEIDAATGKPIRKPTVADEAAALKKENADLKKKNKALTEQLEKLQAST